MVIFQKRVADLTNLALDRFLARARRAAGLKGMVNVLITSSAEMKSLNRRFRGKDKPTDVLSFPADPDVQKQLAGEIAISAEIATKMRARSDTLRLKKLRFSCCTASCICAAMIMSATMDRWPAAKNSCARNSTCRWD